MSQSGGSTSSKSSRKGPQNGEPIVIKKYANRRLYNTATSSYVTLDYLSEMVKNGQDFVVHDAKSGEDITRTVLTQIIFEEENKGQNLLPIQFLRQLIQFYGDNLQSFVPSYLEMSMDAFAKNQDQMREQMRSTFGATPGFSFFEEATRQNMAMFENAMKMFSPEQSFANSMQRNAPKAPTPRPQNDDLDAMRSELENLKRELNDLKKTP